MKASTKLFSSLMGFSRTRRSYIFIAVSFFTFSFLCLANANGFHRRCDMYNGKWVYDSSYPLYNSSACPVIRREFNCLKYGRPNHLYLKYRWKPQNCHMPRFNGKRLLKRLKGKKIMFIGDSISLTQWQSLICMLHAAVPRSRIITQEFHNHSISTVTFKHYKVSVMLFRSLYLVDVDNETIGRVLRLNSIRNGNLWKNIDVLIFNTWHWWHVRGPRQQYELWKTRTIQLTKDLNLHELNICLVNCIWAYVQVNGKIRKDIDRMAAFCTALKTWGKWVDSDVDTRRTKVKFQGISPSHYYGAEWNEPGVRNCSRQVTPFKGSVYPTGLPWAAYVVKRVIRSIKKPVYLLDITALSHLRKDAHPSSCNGLKRMDCTHWCVAGLRDTWNLLLYAALIK